MADDAYSDHRCPGQPGHLLQPEDRGAIVVDDSASIDQDVFEGPLRRAPWSGSPTRCRSTRAPATRRSRSSRRPSTRRLPRSRGDEDDVDLDDEEEETLDEEDSTRGT